MTAMWGDCPECGTWLAWDDIDLDEPTCPECDTPLSLDRGDDYDDFEPDDRGRDIGDRCVVAVNPMGGPIR